MADLPDFGEEGKCCGEQCHLLVRRHENGEGLKRFELATRIVVIPKAELPLGRFWRRRLLSILPLLLNKAQSERELPSVSAAVASSSSLMPSRNQRE